MPVHIPVTARDIFDATRGGEGGEWLIGYRTAREIKDLLDVTPFEEWDGLYLLGRPVTLTTGDGLTFLPMAA